MQGPEEFLNWLDGLVRGETYVQKMRREATERPDDMELRVKLASYIKESGQLDEATTEYVWLWKHMLGKNPETLGLRHIVLPGPMSNLVETHPPARAAFSELRETVKPGLPALEAMDLADWLTLNTVLGEASASLAWYEANAAELAKTQGEVRAAIKNAIIPMLIDARRWSDVGDLEEDPAGEVRRAVEMSEQILKDVESGGAPEDMIAQMKAFSTERVSKTAGMLAKAMRAAGREGDAKLVEEEARKHGIEPSVDDA